MLEKRGIKVDRAFAHPALNDDRGYATPDWTQVNAQGVNNPRDMSLPVGNEIMEAPGSRRARFFEYIAMRPLFEKWIKEDPDFLWTAAKTWTMSRPFLYVCDSKYTLSKPTPHQAIGFVETFQHPIVHSTPQTHGLFITGFPFTQH